LLRAWRLFDKQEGRSQMAYDGYEIARAYERNELVGWAEFHNPGVVERTWNLIKDDFRLFNIQGQTQATSGRKVFLHHLTWKLFPELRQKRFAVPDYYPQEIGDPFVAGTKVLMEGGFEKNIEDITIGETVINHKLEPAKVTNVIKKTFSGDIVTIEVDDWDRKLSATETHHGMVLRFSGSQIDFCRCKFGEMEVGDQAWVPYAHPSVKTIKSITRTPVVDETVYCITTENEWSAIFNGIASYQCVSFGARHATMLLSLADILLRGDREKFRSVFSPYYYGTGRIYVGGWGGYQDGSVGSWMAKAVMLYGTLFSDEPGVPKYSGQVAKSFGAAARNGIDKFKATGIKYPVKSASLIKTWDDLAGSVVNGYPVPTASNLGYSMEPGRDGFHQQITKWNHQMCFIGIDETYGEDHYALLLNSWDDVQGRLKDFQTGEDLPLGILRVRRKDVEKHLAQNECFAYSQFDGFPEQPIERSLFKFLSE